MTDTPLPDPTGKPTTPANLTATAGKGAVTLTWDAVDVTIGNMNRLNDVQITKHQYRQSTDGGNNYGTWTDIPNSGYGEVNATTYTIGSLSDGTEYTFQVRAVNGCTATTGCGNSGAATAVMATPDADALAAPTGLTANAGNTQITLTWTDPGDATIQYYEYQQKEGSAAFGSWTEIRGSSATTTSWRSTGLDNGTAYSYRIRARTDQEVGPASDAVTATPQGTPPATPVLTATPRSGGVTLSWPNPVDVSILRYEYQYKIGTGIYGSWQPARERTAEDCGSSRDNRCRPPFVRTVGATHQFPLGGLTNGTSHTFRIRAVNADGNATSNEATATPVFGVPAKPTGLTIRIPLLARGEDPHRVLEWDAAADPSILRYEYTTDEGRTWTRLTSSTRPYAELPEEEFPSGYTFRIRAVNAAGPGPASDQAVDEGDWSSARAYIQSASLEWNATTKKATLIWDPNALGPRLGRDAEFLWWQVAFVDSRWDAHLPIATTRYEIPATFNAGESISVWIAGCESHRCITSVDWGIIPGRSKMRNPGLSFVAGGPSAPPTGFSATAGDTQITLAWDDPMDSSITKYQYVLSCHGASGTDIPDGDDADSNPGNETSYTITNLSNGTNYPVRLRAVNANGSGPWTECIQNVMPLAAGVPAAPTGVVLLRSGDRSLTRWDDPLDPSITGYQGWSGSWVDLAGTDATTTGVDLFSVIRVRAVNANGFGPPGFVTPVVSPTPAQPMGLQAAPANGRVTLTWDDPGNGVYIWFYRYTTDGGETWTEIPGSESTAEGQLTRYTVPDLTNGQAYTFGIEAVNDAGTSPPSASVTATPLGAPPAKPTDLVVEPGNSQATLTWDNPIDASITKYQVKQDASNWADIAGSDAGTTSHTVGSLANGTAYTFQIRAVNDHNGDNTDDPGAASDAVTVTPGVPAAPAILTVAPGNAQVTLTWTAPASNNGSAVTGYEYTSNADAATPTWTDVPDGGDTGTSRADETEYTVSSLVNNTTYAFAVRAENANGQGSATPTLRATPVHPDAPQRPVGLRANPGDELVRLTWTLLNFQHPVTSYQYRQSTDGGTTWSPDWTAVTGSDADTTEHTRTGLSNGTTYTFELRALNGSTEGPSARAQATPSGTAANEVLDRGSSGQLTTPTGDTYTVAQLSPPTGLNWRIKVPGTTEIDGRTFTVRSLQGTTPETSPRYAFTSTGQEGLDIVVHPPLAGRAQVCLEPTELLRQEAGGRPLLVLRYSGTGWTPLPTTTDGGMVCGTTTDFSGFVLGYAAAGGRRRHRRRGAGHAARDERRARGGAAACAADRAGRHDERAVRPDAVLRRPRRRPAHLRGGVGRRRRRHSRPAAGQQLADPPRRGGRRSRHRRDGPRPRRRAGQPVLHGDGGDGSRARGGAAAAAADPAGRRDERAARPDAVLPRPRRRPAHLRGGVVRRRRARRRGAGGRQPTDPPRRGGRRGRRHRDGHRPRRRARQPAPDGDGADQRRARGGRAAAAADPAGGDDERAARPDAVLPRPGRRPAHLRSRVGQRRRRRRRGGRGRQRADPPRRGSGRSRRRRDGPRPLRRGGQPAADAHRADQRRARGGQPLPAQTLLAGTASEPLDLTPYFDDPDGDPLTFAAVSDNAGVAVAEVAEGGSELTLRAVAVGEAVVVVTATRPLRRGGQPAADADRADQRRARGGPAAAGADRAAGHAERAARPDAVFRRPRRRPAHLRGRVVEPRGGDRRRGGRPAHPHRRGGGQRGGHGHGPRPPRRGGRPDRRRDGHGVVTVTAANPDWVKAWAARFGRTVSGHVLDGVQERLRAVPQPGFQATLGGHQLGGISEEAAQEFGNWQLGGRAAFQRELELLAGWTDDEQQMGNGGPQQGSTARDLFTSSAFSLTVGNAEEGGGGGGFGAVWGRGAVSHFGGQDGALSLDGEVATGMVGIDWVSRRWRTGLALAMSRGSGGYSAGVHSGEIESKLTGLFPWVGYDVTDRVSVWAAAGYGAGVLTLTPENEDALTAELGLSMVAAGARSELLTLRQLGGVMLALETDTRLTRTTTGAIAGLEATEASVWQRRLGLEGSRPLALGGRLSLRPSVEVGLRYDGGDAETGAGMDVGAGLGFADSGTGLAVDVHVRTLLVHEAEGFSERGMALSLSYDPTPSTPLGVTARVAPSWGGQAQSGVAALWGRETMAGMAHGGAAQGYRLNGEVGYGLPVGGRFVGTPRVGFSTSEHSRDYRVGYGLGVLETGGLLVEVGVDALRSESPQAGGASNALRGQASLGW